MEKDLDFIVDYQKAQDALYDHIGFVEDWVPFVIDFRTDQFWTTNRELIKPEYRWYTNIIAYSPSKESLLEGDGSNTYTNEIVGHRFYEKSIYKGESYTEILV